MKKLIISFILITSSFLSFSQTLDETLNWIKGKLADNTFNYSSYEKAKSYGLSIFGERWTLEHYDTELEVIQMAHYWGKNNEESNGISYVELDVCYNIALKEISITSVKIYAAPDGSQFLMFSPLKDDYNFYTHEELEIDFYKHLDPKDPLSPFFRGIKTGSYAPTLQVRISEDLIEINPDICDRLVKAFKHAIKLAGGKEEAF